MNRLLITSVAIAAVAACAQAQAATALSDGNFAAAPDPGTYKTYYANSTFGNWTVGKSGSVDLIGSYWANPPGSRSVDLDGESPGSISQMLNLVSGKTYKLSFKLSGNPDGGSPTKGVGVTIGGDPTQQFTYDTAAHGTTKSDMKWVSESFSFTASSSKELLTFASTDEGSPYGAVIASVAVPEPATWAMMLIGFGGLGAVLRSNRRRVAAVAA